MSCAESRFATSYAVSKTVKKVDQYSVSPRGTVSVYSLGRRPALKVSLGSEGVENGLLRFHNALISMESSMSGA